MKHTIVSFVLAFWPLWVGLAATAVVGWVENRDRDLDRFEYEAKLERVGPARGCLFGWGLVLAAWLFVGWLAWFLLWK